MALMAARGSAGVSRGGGFEHRKNIYKDDGANCGCLPKMKPSTRMTRAQLLKERIRQFSIWYFEAEEHREGEHVKRRFERKKKRKSNQQLRELQCIRRFYIFDAILWVVALTLTLCSTVETIGENTPFYKAREKYRVIGPLTILLAVVLLLTLTAVERRVLKAKKMHSTKKRFYILPKRVKKGLDGKGTSCTPRDSSGTDDSGNVTDIEMGDASQQQSNDGVGQGHSTHIGEQAVSAKHDQGIVMGVASAQPNSESVILKTMESGDRRKAWSKSKWMRTTIPSGSCDSIDDVIHTITQLQASRASRATPFEGKDSLERRPFLQSLSSDSETFDMPGTPEYKSITQLKRDFSSKSKTSDVSNFSNFSETAPLVKR